MSDTIRSPLNWTVSGSEKADCVLNQLWEGRESGNGIPGQERNADLTLASIPHHCQHHAGDRRASALVVAMVASELSSHL
jgi:hypothetical protein